jgi:hypothetical protein
VTQNQYYSGLRGRYLWWSEAELLPSNDLVADFARNVINSSGPYPHVAISPYIIGPDRPTIIVVNFQTRSDDQVCSALPHYGFPRSLNLLWMPLLPKCWQDDGRSGENWRAGSRGVTYPQLV